jgi:hypothetical protein
VTFGRRNWTFAGSDRGGERAAVIYSLIETVKMHGLNPDAYLTHVLEHIASHPVNVSQTCCPGTLPAQNRASLPEHSLRVHGTSPISMMEHETEHAGAASDGRSSHAGAIGPHH